MLMMNEFGHYTEDGAKIMIDIGWLEQLPQVVDKEQLAMMRSERNEQD